VERAVVFLLRAEGAGGMSDPLAVLTTAGPLDQPRVLKAILHTYEGRKTDRGPAYYVRKVPGEEPPPHATAVCFVNDRTLLTGPEGEVRRVLKRPAGAAPGPWEAALRQAAGKHLVVAGLYPPEFLGKWLSEDLLKQKPALQPLLSCKSGVVTV